MKMFWTVSVGIFYLGGELLPLIASPIKLSRICHTTDRYIVTFCDRTRLVPNVIILLSAEIYEEKYRQH